MSDRELTGLALIVVGVVSIVCATAVLFGIAVAVIVFGAVVAAVGVALAVEIEITDHEGEGRR